jgi:hypothetical protein
VSIRLAEPIPLDHCPLRDAFTAVILIQSAPNRAMIYPHDPAVKTSDEHSNLSIALDSNEHGFSSLNPGICPLLIGDRMLLLHPSSVRAGDPVRALRDVNHSHFIVTRKGRART